MHPTATMLDRLRAARAAGGTFAQAWPDALAAALLAADPPERSEWASALAATASCWQHAFERRALQRADQALALVGDGSDRVPQGRACAYCDTDIPPERGRRGPAKSLLRHV